MSDLLSYGPTSDQEIQQQANVTCNLGRTPDCVQKIKFAISSRKKGTYIEGPIDAAHMMVDRLNLIFINAAGRDERSKQPGSMTYQVDSFSSFNGQTYPAGITQKEFERMFKFVGVATGVQDFTGDIPNKAGFAAVTAGSISIKNHSNVTFFPGDLVAWNAPNIDKAKRAEQYKSVFIGHADTNTHVATKNMATLSRVTVGDIVDQWADVADMLISDTRSIKVHEVRSAVSRGAIPPGFTDEQYAAASLKQFVTLVMYQTLVAAFQHDLITPRAALTEPLGSPTMQDYLSQRRKFSEGSDAWRAKQFTAGLLDRDRTAQGVFADQVNNFANNMARLTGLIAPGVASNLTEDEGLVERVLQRVLYSNLGSVDDSDTFTKIISDEYNTAIANLPDIFGNINTSNPSTPLQMLRVKGESLRSLYHSIVTNALSFTDRVIGTASNTSRPGSNIHMVLSS